MVPVDKLIFAAGSSTLIKLPICEVFAKLRELGGLEDSLTPKSFAW